MSKSRFRNYEFLSSPIGKKMYKKHWKIEHIFRNLKENYNVNSHCVGDLSRKFYYFLLKKPLLF